MTVGRQRGTAELYSRLFQTQRNKGATHTPAKATLSCAAREAATRVKLRLPNYLRPKDSLGSPRTRNRSLKQERSFVLIFDRNYFTSAPATRC